MIIQFHYVCILKIDIEIYLTNCKQSTDENEEK